MDSEDMFVDIGSAKVNVELLELTAKDLTP